MITVGTELPALTIDVTPTFVISTALATRDFQDVHHDRDAAFAAGAPAKALQYAVSVAPLGCAAALVPDTLRSTTHSVALFFCTIRTRSVPELLGSWK